LHKDSAAARNTIEVFFPSATMWQLSQYLRRDSVASLKDGSSRSTASCVRAIHRPPTPRTALFEGMFFESAQVDFSRVGRLKFNIKLYENQGRSGLDKRT